MRAHGALLLACGCLLILIALAISGDATAAPITIIDTTFASPIEGQLGITNSQFLSFGFTLTESFNDVAILPSLSSPGAATITAWLTTAIGPTATEAELIASATILLDGTDFAPISVLDGLSLDAGLYFLTLSSTNTAAGNPLLQVHCADPDRCTGAIMKPDFIGFNLIAGPGAPSEINSDLPFASELVLTDVQPFTFAMVQILAGVESGTDPPTTPVPEPTTIAMLALGIAGVGLVARRRRRAA